jgi:hypothetical protein
MPRSLAIGAVKCAVLTTAPAALPALSLATDLTTTNCKDLSDSILKSAYQLGASGADKVNEASLASTLNTSVPGASNYSADMTFFRYLDSSGKSVTTEDVAWSIFTGKGIRVWLVERVGPPSTQPFAVGDVVDIYEVVTDDPQPPKDYASYVKFGQPFHVQAAYHRVDVTA